MKINEHEITEQEIARFWKRVIKDKRDCWTWKGSYYHAPTFVFYRGDKEMRRGDREVRINAIKLASLLTTQSCIDGNTIPTCGNRRCINPKHRIPIEDRYKALPENIDHTHLDCQCRGKRCSRCKLTVCLGKFSLDASRPCDGLACRCKSCEQSKLRTQRYGVSGDYVEKMLVQQNGLCALCHEPFDSRVDGRKYAVDHDHVTGKARSLIHKACNAAIGLLDDSPDKVQLALLYLQSYIQPSVIDPKTGKTSIAFVEPNVVITSQTLPCTALKGQ